MFLDDADDFNGADGIDSVLFAINQLNLFKSERLFGRLFCWLCCLLLDDDDDCGLNEMIFLRIDLNKCDAMSFTLSESSSCIPCLMHSLRFGLKSI